MQPPLAHASTAAAVTVTTRPIPDPIDLLARLPVEDGLAWVRDGEGIVGWGVAATLEVSGRERFSRAHRWFQQWCREAMIDDTVAMPGTGPVAFASFAFDPEPGKSIVVIPEVIIGRRAGQSWVTVIGDRSTKDALRPVSVPARPDSVSWSEGSRSALSWQETVSEAIIRITAGEIDKVVLARDIVATIDGQLDPRYALLNLARDYPGCWTFSVAGLIGATPELLVRRTGDIVSSRVLAGTIKRQQDQSDETLAQALLGSGKDLEEHVYAVQSVATSLAAHCTDMDIPSRPYVLNLSNVSRLATYVVGRLADDTSVVALAASLHPSAAVCGTPTERAMAVIRDMEGMDRDRYAGPVGWFDSRGDGEFGIALRCALIDQTTKQARLFAGCGIVAGSDPASELAESQAKLVPMRDALEP